MSTKKIKQPEGGLLQSREWANFLRAEGKNVIEIDSDNEKKYCTIQKLKVVGRYGYIPRACNINEKNIDTILQKIKKQKVGWLRLDVCDKKLVKILTKKNIFLQKAPHDMQPKQNLIIDISFSEDELLKQMKSKTRYNIRLANKKGIKIFTTRKKKYINIFCDLVEKTGQRKDVNFHNREHYHKMFQEIPKDMLQLYVAEYKGIVIAANIISFYNNVATYLHGATSDEYRNVMAPFALQWRAIQDAKNNGYNWYDFGGVFLEGSDVGKDGITRFKRGFSPKTEYFITEGSYDIIFSQVKYKTYKILQKIKNK